MGSPSVSPGPFSQNTAHGLAGQGSQGWPGCCPSKGAAGWKSPSRWGGAESRAASCAAPSAADCQPGYGSTERDGRGLPGRGRAWPNAGWARGVLHATRLPLLKPGLPQLLALRATVLASPPPPPPRQGEPRRRQTPVSCGPAPRAGAGGAGGLCSAAKGPRTGSVRKANPCQHAWLVDTCMAPCARCATRPSPRPHVLWKSPGLGAVSLLIHFEASQPRAACQLLGASSLLPERGDFL